MTDPAQRRYSLAAARADFLEGVSDPLSNGVPEHVVASWRRSVAQGVTPSLVESKYFDELDFDSRLVRCAEPVVEQVAEQVADIPMCVALTDNEARLLLRRDSASSFGRATDRVYFAQGFGYAENQVGTNGVGTVLESGQPVHIVGPEHFVDTLQPFACAGAPVRDPFTGRVEGVLDISCFAEHSTPVLASLVRMAAARIEHNLLTDRNQAQQALFDVYSRVDARTRGPVLAVGPTIVMANERLQSSLNPDDQASLRDHIRFLMQRHSSVDDRIDLPSGVRIRLKSSGVAVGDDVAGMVGVVTVLNEVDSNPPKVEPEPRRQTRSAPAARQAPTPRQAVSTSAAWNIAAEVVSTALETGTTAVVFGEPGAGRMTLLREQFLRRYPRGNVVELDAVTVERNPRSAGAELRDPASPALYVLQHVDQISESALSAFFAATGDTNGGNPYLAATAGEATAFDTSRGYLYEFFSESATVPPLRHRLTDLPALATVLMADIAPHRDVRITSAAQRVLTSYRWPGNISQLRDALEEALRNRPVGAIDVVDLPTYCQSAPRTSLRPMDQMERDAIVTAIRDAGGNRKAAAAALGLARSTMYRKIRQYGITD